MFTIVVYSAAGDVLDSVDCEGDRATIGKGRQNDVQLRGWRVAPEHAEVLRRADGLFIERLTSKGDLKVNGESVDYHGPIRSRDEIQLGGFTIKVGKRSGAGKTPEPTVATASVEEEMAELFQTESVASDPPPQRPLPAAAPSTEAPDDWAIRTVIGVPHHDVLDSTAEFGEALESHRKQEKFLWRTRVHERLLELMDLRRMDIGGMSEAALRQHMQSLINDILIELGPKMPAELDRDRLARDVLDEAVGLGPLEELLADATVTEIMVNKFDEIFIEQGGRLSRSDITFSSDDAVMSAIERIVAPLGRRIDESSPMVDARLRDGSRVNAIIPPLALRGPCLTIRKFSKKKLSDEDLIGFGAADADMMAFLRVAVEHRRNIVISGGTGSGKTTLLNVLSSFIPVSERIVTVEDAAELKLGQPHLVSLEARPANLEGKGAVPIRDLVKNCLRMRPDRIVVGECRGGEALDMLQAMNTGHDGSLTTAHANSPRDLISRLEVMVMMAGMDLPVQAIREQVASAVDVIVQQTRFADGSRKIVNISEVTGVEGSTVQMHDLFRFRQKGFDADGKVLGYFEPTGRVPQFYEELREQGVPVDLSLFRNGER